MFIPYAVDVPFDRRPFMNWLIVAGVIAIFGLLGPPRFEKTTEPGAAKKQAVEEQTENESTVEHSLGRFVLRGWGLTGLFGHMWLHAGPVHLAGNLLFLWVFGNAVCAKIGNVIYLPVYIGLGLMAAVTHLIFVGRSMIGASGAINGIVGMYLVFFPENHISCLWVLFFPFVKRFTVSSYWMILLWFVFDILGAIFGGQGVAYFAHLGGFAAGFALAAVMLKRNWVVVERYEKSLFQLLGLEKKQTEEDLIWPLEQEYQVLDRPAAEATEPGTTAAEPEKTEEQFIRFACSCGRTLKVAAKYAGKTGRCPGCKMRVRIPDR